MRRKTPPTIENRDIFCIPEVRGYENFLKVRMSERTMTAIVAGIARISSNMTKTAPPPPDGHAVGISQSREEHKAKEEYYRQESVFLRGQLEHESLRIRNNCDSFTKNQG